MPGYYFRLPQLTQLTIDQQAALNETNGIALSGGPGTGKSVVSLWRHLSNHERDINSQLLTYTTSLTAYLKMCCKGQNINAAEKVSSSLSWRAMATMCQEIIIDEAQDLPQEYYDEIKRYANRVSYGADDSQILYPECSCKQNQLQSIFPNNKNYFLSKNFRSTKRIMLFAKQAFVEAFIPQTMIDSLSHNMGELPVLMISEGSKYEISNEKQDDAILSIINSLTSDTHNIAILVPWEKHVDYFCELVAINYRCTKYSNSMNGCKDIGNIHITTFKSSKGLEFDTVIIPNFDIYLQNNQPKFHLNWQDFYVAVTRARSNLYLISNTDIPLLKNVTDITEL